VLWGDLVHIAAIELPLPSAAMAYEADTAQARASRLRVLRDAARERTWIAAAHLGFPGIGKVRADARGGGYTWIPMALVRGR
jgi:glyoxylase-like metal-dependent hydrolase (beta-lactamase superfamily II)